MYNETIVQHINTHLHSDPATCVGCAAFSVSSAWCRELRQDSTCQKRIEARDRMLSVIVQLVSLAIAHKADLGPIVKMLLNEKPPEVGA